MMKLNKRNREVAAGVCIASDAEQHERRNSVDFALASVGLDGFSITDADKVLARRFVAGELAVEDCLADLKRSMFAK